MNDKAAKLTALVIASLSAFITPFMMSSINIALPDIGKEFNADAVMLSWIAASYLLASAVTLVPFGKLADIYGRKKIFMLGMSLFTITSLLCALSVSATHVDLFSNFSGCRQCNVLCYRYCDLKLGLSYPKTGRGSGYCCGRGLHWPVLRAVMSEDF